eukprot:1075316-Ditylum_brightwellii.AAC.1
MLHLLYMDGLSMYAKNDEEMVRCMKLVKKFSDGIGMSFGLGKCAILTIVNGKPVETTSLDDLHKMG